MVEDVIIDYDCEVTSYKRLLILGIWWWLFIVRIYWLIINITHTLPPLITKIQPSPTINTPCVTAKHKQKPQIIKHLRYPKDVWPWLRKWSVCDVQIPGFRVKKEVEVNLYEFLLEFGHKEGRIDIYVWYFPCPRFWEKKEIMW